MYTNSPLNIYDQAKQIPVITQPLGISFVSFIIKQLQSINGAAIN